MKKEKPKRPEEGITLIALIVTIIILVILASITIRGLTGDEGIINSTQTASESYIIVQYKEQIEQLLQGIILEHEVLGEDITIYDIADEMEEENWIKTATVETDTDIIVTTTDGYMYDVYYNEETGEKYVVYLGTEGGGALPTLTATYDEANYEIDVEATCSDGITLIELIYKGETIKSLETNDTTVVTSFPAEKTGLYTIKVASTKGQVRYAYVKVTSNVVAPTIAVTSSGTAVNNWYGSDGVPLEVTITVDGISAGLYYKTSRDTGYTGITDSSKTLTISNQGKTVIYAYNVNSNGDESDVTSLEVKFDNIAPVITSNNIGVEGTKGKNNWYTTDVVLSFESAITDSSSGIAGYYYYTGDDETSKSSLIGLATTIKITTEGETILTIEAEDNAGNKSSESTITINKDSTPPQDFTPYISNEGVDGFTITAGTTDATSGIDYYEFYVGSSKVGTSEDGTFDVAGLSTNSTYTVYVIAYDKAGNSKTSTNTVAKTSGDLSAPTITPTGQTGTNGWYTGDVTVTIKDSADSSQTAAYQIIYEVTGANEVSETTKTALETSFTITLDGTSTITAYVVDKSNNRSDSTTVAVKKDAVAPTISGVTSTGTSSSEATISVTAEDEGTSGLASYKYYFGSTCQTTNSTSDTSDSASITGLTSGDSNSCKVVVTDNAGNTAEKSITVATKLYTWDVYSYVATKTYEKAAIEGPINIVIDNFTCEATGFALSRMLLILLQYNSDS